MELLNEEQRRLVDFVIGNVRAGKKDILVVNSPAGTGKTFCIKLLNQLNPCRIFTLAPTHKAVSLFLESQIYAQTIHRFLDAKSDYDEEGDIQFLFGKSKQVGTAEFHLIIVDEASMVDSVMYAKFMMHYKTYNAMIIFMGDIHQIPPVNEKQSVVFTKSHMVMNLTINMRCKNRDILELCDFLRDDYTEIVLNKRISRESIFFVIQEYFHRERDNTIYLTWTNRKKEQVSNQIRNHLFMDLKKSCSRIPKYIINERLIFSGFRNTKQESWWFLEDELAREKMRPKDLSEETIKLFSTLAINNCLNRTDHIYYSNDIVFIVDIKELDIPFEHEILKMYLIVDAKSVFWLSPKEDSIAFLTSYFQKKGSEIKTKVCPIIEKKREWRNFYIQKKLLFPELDYSYAMTVHKAQGSQWSNVCVDVDTIMRSGDEKKLLYTCVSRATQRVIFTE